MKIMENKHANIRLVTLDIEGCLTIKKGETIPLSAFEIFQKERPNIPIALCTGRPQPYVEAVLQFSGLIGSLACSIVENGCFLYDPMADILIPHPRLDQDAFAEIKQQIKRAKLPEGTRTEPGKEVCVSLNPSKDVGIAVLYAFMQNLLRDNSAVTVAHSNSAVDITPKGIDKAAGLHFLCERMDISPDDVLSVGDSNNDLSVLRLAGYIACPANSTPAVKELVMEKNGYVAEKEYADGVVEILRHYGIFERNDRGET